MIQWYYETSYHNLIIRIHLFFNFYKFLAAHFAKRNTKFGGDGKARMGKNSFPPTPFLFARPSDWISKLAVRIFVKKGSDFNQKAPPVGK